MKGKEALEWLARNVHKWHEGKNFICYSMDHGCHIFHEHNKNCAEWFTRQEWLSMREKLQNKPSWKDAPEWATHLAQNSRGVWFFMRNGEQANSGSAAYFLCDYCWPMVCSGEVLGDYRDTLEKRPESATKEGQNEMTITTQDNSWHERGELPPVGTECEFNHPEFKRFVGCLVVGHHRHEAVCAPSGGNYFGGGASQFRPLIQLRPLRTEREKAIDAACEAIGGVGDDELLVIEKLYDAGMLKQ